MCLASLAETSVLNKLKLIQKEIFKISVVVLSADKTNINKNVIIISENLCYGICKQPRGRIGRIAHLVVETIRVHDQTQEHQSQLPRCPIH